jgi:hypothetical protein
MTSSQAEPDPGQPGFTAQPKTRPLPGCAADQLSAYRRMTSCTRGDLPLSRSVLPPASPGQDGGQVLQAFMSGWVPFAVTG